MLWQNPFVIFFCIIRVDSGKDRWYLVFGDRSAEDPSTPQRQKVELSLFFISDTYTRWGQEDFDFIEGDIALIRFKQPVKFTEYVRPACISASVDEANDYRQCRVAGWGFKQGKKGDSFFVTKVK